MKIRLNYLTYIEIAFVIATVGNSSALTYIGMDEITTYLGLCLIIFGNFYTFLKKGKKNNMVLFCIVSFLFIVGIAMQNISFLLKLKLMMTMLMISTFATLSTFFLDDFCKMKFAAYGIFLGLILSTILAILFNQSLFSIAVEGDYSVGFNGGLQHKNYFSCAMLSIFSILFLCHNFYKKSRIDIILMYISFIFMLLANSRGAIIMFFSFIIVANYKKFINKVNIEKKTITFISIIVLLFCSIFLYKFVISSDSYAIRLRGLTNYLQIYKYDYFHLWFGNAEMAWGSGGNYVDNVRAALGWDATVELSIVSILVKNGFLGLIGYLIIFLNYFKMYFTSRYEKYKTCILSLTICLLFSALVENYITNTHVIFGVYMYCLINGFKGIELNERYEAYPKSKSTN